EISATSNITLAAAPEGALDVVSQTIASAQHTLLIEAYTLKSVPLYEAINARIQAGVAVTILLESKPVGGIEDVEKWIVQQLHNPPASTVYFIGETAQRYDYQHAKFILVDGHLALVSTDNFGDSSMPSDPKSNGTLGHRGFVAVTDSPGVIARLADIFQRDCDPEHHLDVALYDGSFSPSTPLPAPDWTSYTAPFVAPLHATADHLTVLHAPENALRDQDALLGLLTGAGSGDQIAVMQLNEPFTWTKGVGDVGLNPRLQALVTAAQNGAQVRVLLDEYYDLDGGNSETCLILNEIAGPNLTCRLANVTGLGIHAKVFLADVGGERWVHLGSINGSETSNKYNREVALQFRSAEAYNWMQTIFEHDWELGHGPMVYRIHLPLVMRGYVGPADYPLISELFINPGGDDANQEWIELYNPGDTVSIAGWTLGDAINTGDYGDGRYSFPAGAQLAHGQAIVAAACATNFSAAYGKNPDYEWTNCDGGVPNLAPAGSWEGFGLALGNTSDEVLLLNLSAVRVDSAAWGGASRVGVIPFTDFEDYFPSGDTLERDPADTDSDDCSRDFSVNYYPAPGEVEN
ncbi:MAG: lamin tail domain-containing protein, partial [Chloroflexi bacterium]|nr:lamin tail domain-containing protein [Chloroflexota bacterium]